MPIVRPKRGGGEWNSMEEDKYIKEKIVAK